MDREWLSFQEIADELRVPVKSLYAWRARGAGPPGYRLGKHVRVRRTDLNSWLAGRADQPTRQGRHDNARRLGVSVGELFPVDPVLDVDAGEESVEAA